MQQADSTATADSGRLFFFTSLWEILHEMTKEHLAAEMKSGLVNLSNTMLSQKHPLTMDWQHTGFSSLNLGRAEGMQWEETSV